MSEPKARLQDFIRTARVLVPGNGCHMLSEGDACTCPLCDVDRLEARATAAEQEREALRRIDAVHCEERDEVAAKLAAAERREAEKDAYVLDLQLRLATAEQARDQARKALASPSTPSPAPSAEEPRIENRSPNAPPPWTVLQPSPSPQPERSEAGAQPETGDPKE